MYFILSTPVQSCRCDRDRALLVSLPQPQFLRQLVQRPLGRPRQFLKHIPVTIELAHHLRPRKAITLRAQAIEDDVGIDALNTSKGGSHSSPPSIKTTSL